MKRMFQRMTGCKGRLTKWGVALLCGAMMAGLSGCGRSTSFDSFNKGSASAEMGYVTDMESKEEILGEAMVSDKSSAPKAYDTSRKLIKTVEMAVETKEYDVMLEGLNRQIEAFGGYVEHMNTYNGSIYSGRISSRSASLTIRIPQNKLNAFLSEVTDISNVVRRSERVQDVTLAYVDLDSHKQALQTEQARLLELLKKAETIEDIITIEERLSNVRYQIESMESQLRTYDNQVSFSTVYLEVEEVKELTFVAEDTIWERISGGFVGSLHSIGDDFVELVIWVSVNSPFLVIWAIILVACVLIIRKCSLKHRKRKVSVNAGNVERTQMGPGDDISAQKEK